MEPSSSKGAQAAGPEPLPARSSNWNGEQAFRPDPPPTESKAIPKKPSLWKNKPAVWQDLPEIISPDQRTNDNTTFISEVIQSLTSKKDCNFSTFREDIQNSFVAISSRTLSKHGAYHTMLRISSLFILHDICKNSGIINGDLREIIMDDWDNFVIDGVLSPIKHLIGRNSINHARLFSCFYFYGHFSNKSSTEVKAYKSSTLENIFGKPVVMGWLLEILRSTKIRSQYFFEDFLGDSFILSLITSPDYGEARATLQSLPDELWIQICRRFTTPWMKNTYSKALGMPILSDSDLGYPKVWQYIFKDWDGIKNMVREGCHPLLLGSTIAGIEEVVPGEDGTPVSVVLSFIKRNRHLHLNDVPVSLLLEPIPNLDQAPLQSLIDSLQPHAEGKDGGLYFANANLSLFLVEDFRDGSFVMEFENSSIKLEYSTINSEGYTSSYDPLVAHFLRWSFIPSTHPDYSVGTDPLVGLARYHDYFHRKYYHPTYLVRGPNRYRN